MTEKKVNLCAQIPADLHARVTREKEASDKALGEYITELLTEYYEGGKTTMNKERTMAFQISEELFQRLKDYLAAESQRTGKKISQKEFVIGLIEQALDSAEQKEE